MVSVVVNNNVEQALRNMKKKLQKECIFTILKVRRFFESNAEKRKRLKEHASRRLRKSRSKRNSES